MRYLEDFQPGQRFFLGRRTVTRDEIVAFAREFDPQPFHLDEAAAADSIFGGLVARGWHTASIYMRLLVDGLLRDSASLGSPGIDELRWLRPVRPGDTLDAYAAIREVRPSRGKPDRGIVLSAYEMNDANGARVFSMKGVGLFARRPDRAARPESGTPESHDGDNGD